MKTLLTLILSAVLGLGLGSAPAEAASRHEHRSDRSSYSHHRASSHHRHHHHHQSRQRSCRRVYYPGHYSWRHHQRIWVPARTVLVYF